LPTFVDSRDLNRLDETCFRDICSRPTSRLARLARMLRALYSRLGSFQGVARTRPKLHCSASRRAPLRTRALASSSTSLPADEKPQASASGDSSSPDSSSGASAFVARVMPRGPRGATQGPTIECPSCGSVIKARHPDQFRQHVGKCCPDVVPEVPKHVWHDTHMAVEAVTIHEQELLRVAKQLAYATDNRLPVAEVARKMNLPLNRVKALLRKASKAIPLVADDNALAVIFENHELLVVNKPPGLRFHPTHRFEGNSLLSRCLGHVRRGKSLEDLKSTSERNTSSEQTVADVTAGAADCDADAPRIVHRLDMDTSGVCLFVKDATLVDGFAKQFRGPEECGPHGRARKEYLALCVGKVPKGDVVRFENGVTSGSAGDAGDDDVSIESKTSKTFTVDAHIGPHVSIPEARWVHPVPPIDPKFKVGGHPDMDATAPKQAETVCAVLSREHFELEKSGTEDKNMESLVAALVRARPLTGRTHQIRVHLAHARMPILSDPLYGPHVMWGGADAAENRSDADVVFGGTDNLTEMEKKWGGDLWLGRQALHAHRLTVTHPKTGEKMTFVAAMPEDMRKACVALGVDTSAAET
jgi:23S rRNA pseudouridine1911/1915/1917 synthase